MKNHWNSFKFYLLVIIDELIRLFLIIHFKISANSSPNASFDAFFSDILLLSALNSTTKPRCRGCRTGFFCPGDGTEKPCGEGSPTEFSFGAAANCSACPEGWVGEVSFCVIEELFGIQKVSGGVLLTRTKNARAKMETKKCTTNATT